MIRHRFTYCTALLLLLLCTLKNTTCYGQYFQLNENSKRVTMDFKMIRNMIIIKLDINGKGPYNFILDTGVGIMVITDPALIDTLNIPHKRLTKLAGLGNNDGFDAYATCPLHISMPGLTSVNVAPTPLPKIISGFPIMQGYLYMGCWVMSFLAAWW
jgi:hypothetical protein